MHKKFLLTFGLPFLIGVPALATIACKINDNGKNQIQRQVLSFISKDKQTDHEKYLSAKAVFDFSTENVTTRAGLPVRKSVMILGIYKNLGIKANNSLSSQSKFVEHVNNLLDSKDQLKIKSEDIDKVYISTNVDTNKNIDNDFVKSTYKNPIVTENLKFVIIKKDKNVIEISGELKIKLDDYRKVDSSTLQATTKNPVIDLTKLTVSNDSIVNNKIEASKVINYLNQYFKVAQHGHQSPNWPLKGNIDENEKFIFKNVSGENQKIELTDTEKNDPKIIGIKYTLPESKIHQLIKLYETNAKLNDASKTHGDFPKARVGRAVEELKFELTDKTKEKESLTLNDQGEVEIEADLTISFISHWGWIKKPEDRTKYLDRIREWKLTNIKFKVKFNKTS
ncbi:LIPOPROTEIN [Mycoplasmopsis pulmonis]|uniref:LIPOPROTEIN n=1 Tax=Mycoplasmopsis pulmonis (strain UAB CTIP) TaxID=272635 RepID=Q98RF2_MYCPU|nr:hypothetical protein [Mycoplasmopsis pulmonis]CAC13230.1 LIPOPROTEIN [Mycoplasmopsis pulmonis]VEU67848.1 Uncharacterised protein [Mycoplasmopsis pulmonis]